MRSRRKNIAGKRPTNATPNMNAVMAAGIDSHALPVMKHKTMAKAVRKPNTAIPNKRVRGLSSGPFGVSIHSPSSRLNSISGRSTMAAKMRPNVYADKSDKPHRIGEPRWL